MERVKRKYVIDTLAKLLLIISMSISLSCNFEFGGDPIDDNEDDDDAQCTAEVVERVSVASNGAQANGNSDNPSISSDGQWIGFISEASNLVLNDSNAADDVFVHDRNTGTTERASVASGGAEADDDSFTLSLSSNGDFVAFGSFATNLVNDDNNDFSDIFVHDLITGNTERVSVATNGAEANGDSFDVDISSDGLMVSFMSEATNLVANDTNGKRDIFVHDRITGKTERVSIASDGTQADEDSSFSAISSDGRYVAFSSAATNLVADDTNGLADFFVHDRQDATTELVIGPSVFDIGGGIVNVAPMISPDGIFVGFRSPDDDLVPGDTNNSVDTFLINRDTDIIERLSLSSSEIQGNADSGNPSISTDNQFVVFPSNATNLVSNDTNGVEDVFVRNRDTGNTRRVSLTFDCVEGDLGSFSAVISADGEFVAIASLAENLVDNDTNNFADIFVIPNPLIP